jgi:hypothetical protein
LISLCVHYRYTACGMYYNPPYILQLPFGLLALLWPWIFPPITGKVAVKTTAPSSTHASAAPLVATGSTGAASRSIPRVVVDQAVVVRGEA